jgi:hypothetical protein
VRQIVSRGDPHADSGAAGPSLTTFVLLVLPDKTSNRVGERKAGHRCACANRSSMASGACPLKLHDNGGQDGAFCAIYRAGRRRSSGEPFSAESRRVRREPLDHLVGVSVRREHGVEDMLDPRAHDDHG